MPRRKPMTQPRKASRRPNRILWFLLGCLTALLGVAGLFLFAPELGQRSIDYLTKLR